MTELELSIKALQAGILPAFTGDEVAKLLETCDPAEAYKLKRRFRKLWRKELKASLREAESDIEAQRIATSFLSPKKRRFAVRKKLGKTKD